MNFFFVFCFCCLLLHIYCFVNRPLTGHQTNLYYMKMSGEKNRILMYAENSWGRGCISISSRLPSGWSSLVACRYRGYSAHMVQQGQQNATHTSAGGLAKFPRLYTKQDFSHMSTSLRLLIFLWFFSCSVMSDSFQPDGLQRPGFPVLHHLPELPRLMSIESVMPSNHLILCRTLLLMPSVFPSIKVFSNKLALHITWPKYWSFSFSISPSN